jgi:hypothetical protein
MQESALDGMALVVLEDRRVRFLLLADDYVEDCVRPVLAGERVAQLRLGHDECTRLECAPVENARNQPLLAQAPIGSATALRSFLKLELYSLSSHGAEV